MLPNEEILQVSDVYTWNEEAKERIIVNQGGTSSGKTYSILQLLFTKAISEPNLVITVAGQDIPNLKAGALRDAANIVRGCKVFSDQQEQFNISDRRYIFKNGSVIEFNSYDNAQDAKSGKRDYLFINEANGISYEIFFELELRTRAQTFLDYNPNEEFWVHEKLIGEENVRLIISNFLDNPFLPIQVVDKIAQLESKDKDLWKVYGLGLTGKIEGLIFRNYEIVEDVPPEATFLGAGLDFGFTNDPTAFVSVYRMDGELYVDERIYQSGLTNPEIASKLLDEGFNGNIIADSAEPKSIKELQNLGLRVQPAAKGPDSIRNGINVLKRYKINITKRSFGLKKEIKGYKWKVDKATGKSLNEPIEYNNHALDALRYLALGKLNANQGTGNYVFG
jgi:phage terminase large subunit